MTGHSWTPLCLVNIILPRQVSKHAWFKHKFTWTFKTRDLCAQQHPPKQPPCDLTMRMSHFMNYSEAHTIISRNIWPDTEQKILWPNFWGDSLSKHKGILSLLHTAAGRREGWQKRGKEREIHFKSFACEIDWHLDQKVGLEGGARTHIYAGPVSLCGDSSCPVWAEEHVRLITEYLLLSLSRQKEGRRPKERRANGEGNKCLGQVNKFSRRGNKWIRNECIL